MLCSAGLVLPLRCRVHVFGLVLQEMFASSSLSSIMATQTLLGTLNMQSTALCSVLTKRKKKKKNKNSDRHTIANGVEESKKESANRKRKCSVVLDVPGSRHESTSLDSAQLCKAKRVKSDGMDNPGCPFSLCDWEMDSGFSSEVSPSASGRSSPSVGIHPTLLVAMDCEMVGTGPNGQCSELARCSLINYSGTVIYDKYVLPRQPVTDYRTQWSGIRKEHLMQALPFREAKKEILQILKGKVIIGHALNHDFAALDVTIPHHMIRDTSSMPLLRQMYGCSENNISLKNLSSALLSRSIQVSKNGHCSVEDARAALDLYKLVEEEWEKWIQDQNQNSCLKHYMEDQYWPESLRDCDE